MKQLLDKGFPTRREEIKKSMLNIDSQFVSVYKSQIKTVLRVGSCSEHKSQK